MQTNKRKQKQQKRIFPERLIICLFCHSVLLYLFYLLYGLSQNNLLNFGVQNYKTLPE